MFSKIVAVALLTATVCTALSGFYYDNGVDQTIVHKELSKREKREMQSEILHLLGLEHRPHPSFSTSHRKLREADKIIGSSAPRFLIDVYQSLTEEDSGDLKLKPDLIEKEFNVSDKDVYSMDEADIIMSFINRGQHLHGIRHHHSDGRFWFDLSEVPNQTTVIASEMRIFVNYSMVQEEEENPNLAHDSEFFDEVDDASYYNPEKSVEEYTLTLYEIGKEDSLSYVDRVEVDSRQEGWIAFNVTQVLRHWLNNPNENFGLQLVCRHISTGRQLTSREIGMVGSHGNHKQQPFMVAFFRSHSRPTSSAAASSSGETGISNSGLPIESEDEEDEEEIPRTIGRFRRQANNRKRRKDAEENSGAWNPYAEFSAHYARRSCQKKNLYVSFRDLGWQDWIIAPDGYAAFYCNGECSFPLNAHMNASNHAIVQTLVHLMNPYRVPKPCCAPIKLSSISVLYFDDNSNVILKKYRNMVVKSCGCH